MKLGVFGGTFDPIHVGHLIIAEHVRERVGLDRILFVPTGQPWMKANREVTSGPHRLSMVERATATNPHFRVSDAEVARPGPTYTADTVVQLKESLERGSGLYLILGLDALNEIGHWHQPQRILELVTLVGVVRPGFEKIDSGLLESVRKGASTKVIVLEGPLACISATEIRRRVSKGLTIKYLVPKEVETYIYEHGLYKEAGGAERRNRGQFGCGKNT